MNKWLYSSFPEAYYWTWIIKKTHNIKPKPKTKQKRLDQ